MSATNEEMARQLKRLARYNKDAAGSFDTAAQKVDKTEYSTLFRKYEREHSQFANDLETQANTLAGRVEEAEETSLGKIYQGWMKLKSALSEDDLESMLEETQRMEGALIDQYEDAMQTDWTPEIQQKIADQFATLKQARTDLQKRH
ncbi:PA2169 family four-helix-bundle protein [Persicimonas caeni]|uniref:PA2169 family four-helix-bundle protein n=1 Tax=Persicimonas caeni TaxID=2292766 RepID=A0A4Y6PWC2_PERCE|nr:PA2169 family four-helix-bundle protein [Persicimonas caeni]QDG52429.1 PA2169 family four-helix-bundle protein [Persicimonas caeni]QED33651.1 PA2169 family four-helix-bundle protein [Persicimonas caeni]